MTSQSVMTPITWLKSDSEKHREKSAVRDQCACTEVPHVPLYQLSFKTFDFRSKPQVGADSTIDQLTLFSYWRERDDNEIRRGAEAC